MIWIFSHCFQISRKLGAAPLSLELVLSIIQRGKYYVAHEFPRTHYNMSIIQCPIKTCLWSLWPQQPRTCYSLTMSIMVTLFTVLGCCLLLLCTPSIQRKLRGEEREMMRRYDLMDGHGVHHLAWPSHCVPSSLFVKIHGINYISKMSPLSKIFGKIQIS